MSFTGRHETPMRPIPKQIGKTLGHVSDSGQVPGYHWATASGKEAESAP